ncbi:MAG: hypothetical protein Alpg2KO_24750 [Alphaproteobacteria bacterium]
MKESVKIAILVGAVAVFGGVIWLTTAQQRAAEDGRQAIAPATDGKPPAPQRPPPVSAHSPRAPSPEPSPTPELPGGLFKATARTVMSNYCLSRPQQLTQQQCDCITNWMLENTNPALISYGTALVSKALPNPIYSPDTKTERELMVAAGIANRATATARFNEEEFKAARACNALPAAPE